MKKVVLFLLILSGFAACNQKQAETPDTALDTGREFIRASLNGDFEKASALILSDSQNVQLFDS